MALRRHDELQNVIERLEGELNSAKSEQAAINALADMVRKLGPQRLVEALIQAFELLRNQEREQYARQQYGQISTLLQQKLDPQFVDTIGKLTEFLLK